MHEFDEKRAFLKSPDLFNRFKVEDDPVLIHKLSLHESDELLVFEFEGSRYGFLLKQMAYHHVAQGAIEGRQFMVSFCEVCHSGMGFLPLIEGKIYHFSVGGLYDGQAILIDDETKTYWHHTLGTGLHGKLKGKKLESFNMYLTTVNAELLEKNPAKIWVSDPSFIGKFFGLMAGKKVDTKGFMMPFFPMTMGKLDERLDKMEQGLGVVINNQAKFYPKQFINQTIEDSLAGEEFKVYIREVDHVPCAQTVNGDYPLQLFSRWYGFSFTYPDCEVYDLET